MLSTSRRTPALLAAALVPAGLLLAAAPARAADTFVEVNPSTVQAGLLVGIRASCRDNSSPATVESPAFGSVTVHPQAGFLTAAALVPEGTRPDSYRVRLRCTDGRTATTRLMVIAADRPSRGPATGFGGTTGDDPGRLLFAGGLGATVLGVLVGLSALRRRGGRAAARPVPGPAGN
jgi:hypothetical protein